MYDSKYNSYFRLKMTHPSHPHPNQMRSSLSLAPPLDPAQHPMSLYRAMDILTEFISITHSCLLQVNDDAAKSTAGLIKQCVLCKKRYKGEDHMCVCAHEYIDNNCLVCTQKLCKPVYRKEREFITEEEVVKKRMEEIEKEAKVTAEGARLLEIKSAFKAKSSNSFHCNLCNVTCYSDQFYQAHLAGKKHRAKTASDDQTTPSSQTKKVVETDQPKPSNPNTKNVTYVKRRCLNQTLLSI